MNVIKLTPLCALLGLLMGAPGEASATIFKVYVSGYFGGQVQVDGSIGAPPPGACGIRWTNPDAWFWGDGGMMAPSPMVGLPNDGIPVSELSYTGPYTGCGDDPYVFVTPATPSGWPPEGAVALIVQVGPGDYEWLDAHANPIPDDPTPPDPDPISVCEQFPEFCETPQTLLNADKCIVLGWCDGARFPTMAELSIDATDYILDIVTFLQQGLRSELEDHLEQPFVGPYLKSMFREISPALGSIETPGHIDYFTVGIGHDLALGQIHAEACIHAASELLLESFWLRHQLEEAYALCGLSSGRYTAAHARLKQLADAEEEASSSSALSRQ